MTEKQTTKPVISSSFILDEILMIDQAIARLKRRRKRLQDQIIVGSENRASGER